MLSSTALLISYSVDISVKMLIRLNCSSISHDGSLVAGGFSDSSLKVRFLIFLLTLISYSPATDEFLSFMLHLLSYRCGIWQKLGKKVELVNSYLRSYHFRLFFIVGPVGINAVRNMIALDVV